MMQPQDAISLTPPSSWRTVPFWSLFRREKLTGFPDEELLSVYRDHGVVPTASRDDNHNKPSEDLSGYQLVTEGALVTNKMKAWQGSISISRHRGIVSPAYYVYRPLSEEHDQFLHYLLRSEPYIALYQRISKGVRVNQWDLEHEALRAIPVLLPDLPTQKRIAAFLDREAARIDELIAKKERLVEVLRLRRLGRIMDLTSGNMPEQPLHRMYWVQTGKTPSRSDEGNFSEDDGMPWATPADLVEDSPITETKEGISVDGLVGMKPVPKGTVLVNGIGAGVGKVGISGTEMVFNQQIHGLLPKRDIHISSYLLFCMIARRDEMLTLANLNTIPILNGERLGRLALPVPDMSVQERVVAEINREGQFQRGISGKTVRSIDRLREYRAALITAAVTGQIDVDTYGRAGATSEALDRIEEEMQA